MPRTLTRTSFMMRYSLLALLICTVSLQSNPSPRSVLHQKNSQLSLILTRSYGRNNPFLELTSVIELTEELRTMPSSRAHVAALTKHANNLLPAVEACLEAFEYDRMRAPALKRLTELANSAGFYICTNLSQQAAQAQTAKKYKRSRKRIMSTLVGASLFSGTIKYVILGMLCTSVFGLCWSVYHSWTRPVKETTTQILRKKNKIRLGLKEFTQAAEQYRAALSAHAESSELKFKEGRFKRAVRNLWEQLKNKLRSSNDQQIKTKTIRSSLNQLDAFLHTVEGDPKAFGISQQDMATIAQARMTLRSWQSMQQIN